MNERPRAAILIIGDEILKGQVVDTNTSYATKLFYSLGIEVSRIVVIGDDIDEISREVRQLSESFTFIITSGGVGPTHDDVTYEAVAKAFNQPLKFDKEIANIIKIFYNGPYDVEKNPAMKMAWVPNERELLFVNRPKEIKAWAADIFPTVKVKNVYIFPGLPQCFEASLFGLRNQFPCALGVHCCDVLYFKLEEEDIVPALNSTLSKFGKKVTIGSYPVLNNPKYRTRLTLQAQDFKTLSECVQFICGQIRPESIVDMSPDDPVQAVLEKTKSLPCHNLIQHAFNVLHDCYEKYKPEEVAISFNGGKDCTLLLHLLSAFLQSRGTTSKELLQAFYVRCPEPFTEVETFIQEAKDKYKLDIMKYDEDIKTALNHMLSDRPSIKAVLMGNRKTDPYAASLKAFQMTDKGWPQVMRIFPLLDLSYRDVWQVLLALRVPYCQLYDQGYTSLGNRRNTVPNPSLRYLDEDGIAKFRPAYQLGNSSEERVGRQTQP